MKCNEFRKFIQSYLDGEPPDEFDKGWCQHLEECSGCQEEVRIYEKCIGMLQRFMGEKLPPATLRERLRQRLGRDCFEYCCPAQPQKT